LAHAGLDVPAGGAVADFEAAARMMSR
jgi:hypothetical protein